MELMLELIQSKIKRETVAEFNIIESHERRKNHEGESFRSRSLDFSVNPATMPEKKGVFSMSKRLSESVRGKILRMRDVEKESWGAIAEELSRMGEKKTEGSVKTIYYRLKLGLFD